MVWISQRELKVEHNCNSSVGICEIRISQRELKVIFKHCLFAPIGRNWISQRELKDWAKYLGKALEYVPLILGISQRELKVLAGVSERLLKEWISQRELKVSAASDIFKHKETNLTKRIESLIIKNFWPLYALYGSLNLTKRIESYLYVWSLYFNSSPKNLTKRIESLSEPLEYGGYFRSIESHKENWKKYFCNLPYHHSFLRISQRELKVLRKEKILYRV